MTTFAPPDIKHLPPGEASELAVQTMRLGLDPIIRLITPGGRMVWHLGGGKAPTPGAEPGLTLQTMTGANAPIRLIDLQGARQHGVTNTDMLLDPMELDFTFTANAPLHPLTYLPDPNGMRRILRWWFETWAGNRQSKVTYYTPEMGEWWATCRQFKPLTDVFKLSYAQTGQQQITWSARGDDAFWFSFDDSSEFYFSGAGTRYTDWLLFANRGTEKGWLRFLCYGPGCFDIVEPGGNVVSFGPLLDGQVVLITTRPGLRSVFDVTPVGAVPPQQLTDWQRLLLQVINFVTNNNTPPLLTMLESWFGVLPPQGQLYGLLANRFKQPLPAIEEGRPPPTARIQVTMRPGELKPLGMSGGPLGLYNLLPPAPGTVINPIAGKTRIVGALTPARVWPE